MAIDPIVNYAILSCQFLLSALSPYPYFTIIYIRDQTSGIFIITDLCIGYESNPDQSIPVKTVKLKSLVRSFSLFSISIMGNSESHRYCIHSVIESRCDACAVC